VVFQNVAISINSEVRAPINCTMEKEFIEYYCRC